MTSETQYGSSLEYYSIEALSLSASVASELRKDFGVCADYVHERFLEHAPQQMEGISSQDIEKQVRGTAAIIDWVLNGAASIRLTSKQAAALLSTSVPVEHVSALRIPFRSFRIEVPEELGFLWEARPIRYLIVTLYNGQHINLTLIPKDNPTDPTNPIGLPLGTLKIFVHVVSRLDKEGAVSKSRLNNLFFIQKLLIGVCLEFMRERPTHVQRYPITPRNGRIRGKEFPTCNTYTLISDVKVDCVQAVRDWIQGKRRGPLTIQSLVRGHWKRVAIGARRLDRAWRWIQPYWKGPEDAPIAVRSHVLGAPE